MQTWSFVEDKSEWGNGPWNDEPDKVQWTDEGSGLPCLAVRHSRFGHWCGYVGVDGTHHYFGIQYSDVPADVHGGLTFSDYCSGAEHGICHVVEPDHIWWLGFDCAHFNDRSPGRDDILLAYGIKRYADNHYWTLDEVQAECKFLAAQLAERS